MATDHVVLKQMEDLKGAMLFWSERYADAMQEIRALQAEVNRLDADNERLRRLLSRAQRHLAATR